MRMWIAAILSSLLLAGAASALPGISLSQPLPKVADDACPLLTQIKYPWLRCAQNAHGGKSFTTTTVQASASWETDRSIAIGHDFVEGEGAWLDSVE